MQQYAYQINIISIIQSLREKSPSWYIIIVTFKHLLKAQTRLTHYQTEL